MSRQIDERVVSMRFDNKQFEKGVSETMRTLEKFEAALKFEESSKGLENVAKAADKIDISHLGESARQVEVRFSAMEIAAITAISNIVTAAQSAGTKLVKSLSIDQVTAGFDKYQQKTAAVQTIMNATGKSVEEVTAQLAKLQWFSDETSYSFTDMVSNVGKFTSNSIDLSVAVSAMQGIATAAAHAGANTTEASRAMYNFSQAMAKGYVQLIDWKSIENANMATTTFKQTIIDTAVSLGTLIETQNGYVTVAKRSAVSASNFNEALSEGWLTNDVLLQALGTYSAYADAVYEVADGYDTAAEAMEHVSEKGMELGAQAFKAAQQAKTFQEAIDATKDAVSSGWMETFEILFGNFDESVELWTEFTNTLWDIFASGAETRNEILQGALMSGWNQFIAEGITDVGTLKNSITEVAKELLDADSLLEMGLRAAAETGSEVFAEVADDYQATVDDVIEAAGGFEKALKYGIVNTDILSEAIERVNHDFETLSEEELAAKGYTKDTVKTFTMLKKAIDDGSISIEDYVEQMTRMSGRENLIQGLRNAYQGLLSVIEPIKEAVAEIFPPITVETVYNLTESFKNFTAQLRLSDEAAYTLKVVMKGLLIPIRAIVEVVKLGAKAFALGALGVFKLVDAFAALLAGGGPIPDLLKKIFGDERYNRIAAALAATGEHLSEAFSKVVEKLNEFYIGIKNSERAQEIFQRLQTILTNIGQKILDKIVRGFEALASIDFSGIVTFVEEGLRGIVNFFNGLEGPKEFFTGLLETLKSFGSEANELPSVLTFLGDGVKALTGFFKGFTDAVADFVSRLTPAKVLIFAFGASIVATSFSILTTIDTISKGLTALTGVANAFSKFVNTFTSALKPSTMQELSILIASIAGSIAVLALLPIENVTAAMGSLILTFAAFAAIFIAVGKMLGGSDEMVKRMQGLGKALITFSASVMILAGSLLMLSKVDFNAVSGGLMAMAALLTMVAFVSVAISKNVAEFTKGAFFLIGFALSVDILAMALQSLAKVDFSNIEKNMVGFIAAITAMLGLALISGRIESTSFLGMAGLAIGLFAVVKILEKLAKVNVAELVKGLIGFIPVFTALTLLMGATRKAGKNAVKAAGAMILVSGAVLIMGKAIAMIAALPAEDIVKAGIVTGAMLTLFSMLIKATGENGKYAKGIGLMFMEIGASMLLLAGAIAILGLLDPLDVVVGTLAVSALLGMFTLLIKSTENVTDKAKVSIVAMTTTIGLLIAAVALMSLLEPQELVGPVAAVSIILLSLGYLFRSLKEMPLSKLAGQIALLVVIMLGMAKIATTLSGMETSDAIQKAAALGIIMLSLAATAGIISKLSLDLKDIPNYLTTVALMAGVAGVAVQTLAALPDTEAAIQKSAALSIIMLSLAGVVAILNNFQGDIAKAWSNLAILATFAVALSAFVGGLGWISEQVGSDIFENGAAIALKLAGLSVVIAAIGGIGLVIGNLAKSFDAGAAIAGMAKIGAVAVAVIGVIGVVSWLLGELNNAFGGQVDETILEGFDILNAISYGIGEFVGNLVGGLGAGLVSGLPAIGNALGEFGANIQPFVTTLNRLKGGAALEAVGALVSMLFALTANDLIQGITKFFGVGFTSLSDLANALNDFAPKFVSFAEEIGKIPPDTIDSVSKVCTSLSELATSLPASGGLLQKFFGTQDLGKFSSDLSAFADGFVTFYNTLLSGGEIDYKIIDSATSAAKALAGLAGNLPASGGTLQKFLGEQDMGEFGYQLALFAAGFVEFYKNLTANGPIDSKVIDSATNSAKALAGVASNIPASGGWLQGFLGSQDMSVFGEQLSSFGKAFSDFYGHIRGLNVDEKDVKSCANVTKALVAMSEEFPTSGGLFGWLKGESDMGKFGEELRLFGEGIAAFFNAIRQVQNSGDFLTPVNVILDLFDYVNSVLKTQSGIFGTKFGSFGADLQEFAQGIKDFFEVLTSFSWADIDIGLLFEIKGAELMDRFMTGMNVGIPEVVSTFKGLLDSMLNSYEDYKKEFFTRGEFFGDHIIGGLKTKLGISATGNSSVMNEIGVACIKGFIEGFASEMNAGYEIVGRFGRLVHETLAKELEVNSPSRVFMTIGGYCAEGFAIGFEDYAAQAVKSVISFANSVYTSIRNFFGIHSPSTLMRDEVGRYIVEGVAEGISSDMSAEEAAKQKAQNIVAAFQDEFDKFSLNLNTLDLEYQLWEAMNPNAGEESKAAKKAEFAAKKMESQAQRVLMAQAQYEATMQATGETSRQTQEAYNTYLQEQITMANLAQTMLSGAADTGEVLTDVRMDYVNWMRANQSALLAEGKTAEEISEMGKEITGFGSAKNASKSVKGIMDEYLQNAREQAGNFSGGVEVVLKDSLSSAVSSAARGASGSASSAGASLGGDFSSGFGGNLTVGEEIKKAIADSTNDMGLGSLLGTDEAEAEEKSKGVIGVVDTLFNKLNDKVGDFKNIGNNFITNLFDGIKDAAGMDDITGESTVLKDAAKATVDSFSDTVESTESKEKLYNSAEAAVTEIDNATKDVGEKVTNETVPEVMGEVANAVDAQKTHFEAAGENATQGYVDGMTSEKMMKKVTDAGTELGRAAYLAAMKALEEHSPSRKFYKLGMWADMGLANGIRDNTDAVVDQVDYMCSCIAEAADKAIADSYEDFTITPVVDSSQFDDFWKYVLQFDAEGNLVPYGFYNTEADAKGRMGSWIKTDAETVKAAYEAFDELVKNLGGVYHQDYKDLDPSKQSQLLSDLWAASQENQGWIRKQDYEEWQSAPSYNYSFVQNITSPKAVSEAEVYRDTKNLFSVARANIADNAEALQSTKTPNR